MEKEVEKNMEKKKNKNENSYLNKRLKIFKKDAKKSIILALVNVFLLICPFFINYGSDGSGDFVYGLFLIILSITILGPISIISNIVTLIVHNGITKIKNNKDIIILYVFVWIGLFVSLLPYIYLLLQYINE